MPRHALPGRDVTPVNPATDRLRGVRARAPRARVLVPVMLAATLILAAQWWITVAGTDRARLTFDSAEYAVAGRTLARTGQIATTFVLPHESMVPRRPPFPLILGHPAVPMLDAAMFRLQGEHASLTVIPAMLAALVLVALALRLALALGASEPLAALAALAVAIHPRVLYYASEGLTELPFAALLMAATLLLARQLTPRRSLALGLVLGLGHLVRPVMVPLLPAWLLAAALAEPANGAARRVGLVLLGFAPFALGLALYKLLAAGSAFADIARYNLLIGLEPRFTALSVQCMLNPPEPLAWIRDHPAAMIAKLMRHVPGLLLAAAWQVGLPGVIAIGGAMIGLAERRTRALGIALLGVSLTLVALIAASLPSTRYLMPVLPLLLVFGLVSWERIGRRVGLANVLSVGLALLGIAMVPLRATVHDWRVASMTGQPDRGVIREREWHAAGRQIGALVPDGSLCASDAGAFVAWYADRPAVLLPEHPEDLAVLSQRLPVDAVVLTDEWLLAQPGFEAWQAVSSGRDTLAGWTRAGWIEAGRLHALVLRRSTR